MPREPAEVDKMTIHEELRTLGYKLEYECGHSEDRTEVWINEKAGMAVRIEWMRVVGEGGEGLVTSLWAPALAQAERWSPLEELWTCG